MYNSPSIEQDDLIAAVIRIWSETSALVSKSREKQRELAMCLIQTFDSLHMTHDDFISVVSEVGEDTEFADVLQELYGDEEEVYEDDWIDEDQE